jgi:hypothetical protein
MGGFLRRRANILELVYIVAAGLLGTSFMSGLMTVIHRKEWANADMIRALGSFVTRSYESSLVPGLIVHLCAGIGFAFAYAWIVTRILGDRSGGALLLCAILGLMHGIVVGLMLIGVVSKRHPVERFRSVGMEVAAAHLAGHLAYGLGVGLVLDLFDVRWMGF